MDATGWKKLIDDARWLRQDAIATQAMAIAIRSEAQRIREHSPVPAAIASIELEHSAAAP
ncbi:hypothetical protein GCM10010472_64470 [Pseudonocardia halophobica]|uniref:Uncharacterized protein n=1 Tax=Pseudonocardia halophobica TaxID=29401 RepID=A0A9W6UFL6_9PSEU|nr:hypothetical protein [Pseudonocardia halophobica]GLL15517.1 hypothetical protein GCM10017577_66680 [Pseudonocardia halophobica]